MSRDLDDIMLDLPCKHCKAEPGQPCTKPSGKVADNPHSPRKDPIWEAYGEGVESVLRDIVRDPRATQLYANRLYGHERARDA